MIREFGLSAAVIAALISMVLPLPTWLIDLLLVTNLLFALLLLLNALYVQEVLKLSSLPSLILLATLARLALNISTTRAILSTGEAGRAIEAFGTVVIGDSLITGSVLFLVISFVQFIVIAKGSERVAEVAARFTLDALPGKQMSIDADVRAGLIDFDTARIKRQELQAESRFYGALDGAMKFIKGDAIAGVAIIIINIVGGLVMGVLVQKMELAAAVSHYTLLTVGDGMLAQVPALLNSLAAGMVVTRVERTGGLSLSGELVSQIGQSHRVLVMAGSCALLLGVLPGMPTGVFALVGAALFLAAARARSGERKEAAGAERSFSPQLPPLLQLEIPPSFADAALSSKQLRAEIENVKARVFRETGLLVPSLHLSVLPELDAGYVFRIRGIERRRSRCVSTRGEECSRIFEEITSEIIARATELIDDSLTRRLLNHFDNECAELVASVIPSVVSLTQLTALIRQLLREGVPVINFDLVLQAVAEHAPKVSSDLALLEEVRVVMKNFISHRFAREGTLCAVTVEPALDLAIARLDKDSSELCSRYLSHIAETVKSLPPGGVLVVSRRARHLVKESLDAHGVKLTVLALEEIADDVRIERAGHVGLPETLQSVVFERLAA